MIFLDQSYIKAEGIYYGGIIKDIKKHKNALQPIFEAFTNALESISLSKKINASLTVRLFFFKNLIGEKEFYKVEIEDTGVGFTDEEFKRFNTYKDDRKGYNNKGSGRLQLLHYFHNCSFVSSYKQDEKKFERRFKISKADSFIQENAVTFLESTKVVDYTECKTTVSLGHLRDDKDKAYFPKSVSELKEKLLNHYIQYFCLHRNTLPKIELGSFINDQLEEKDTINLEDIPEVNNTKTFLLKYNKLASDGKSIIGTDNSEEFTIKAFRIPKEKLDKNSIKLTSKDELIESSDFKLNLSTLTPDDHINNNRFLFLVSSDYINKKDDDQRGELKIVKREDFLRDQNLFTQEEIFLDDIEKEANNTIVLMYQDIKAKNEEKKLQIEGLKSMFLLNDEVLRNISISLNDTEEKILEKVYTAESKLIAKGDYEIKKQISELDSLNPASPNYEQELNQAINKLVKEIPQQNRVALTHYVARRKLVLELFDKILNKKLSIQAPSNRNIDEKLLHNLIFKQKSDNSDTSDLWLISEDFILFKGTSESKLKDLQIEGVKIMKETLTDEEKKYKEALDEDRYEKRPDVLLFPDEGKCIIIEFKSPGVNVSEHINQINRYASIIRNLSKEEYQFDTFYGYLIGETIDPNDVRDFDADFKEAAHFDFVFRPYKTIAGKFGRSDASLYTEVIKYSTLKERAKKRNNIFIDKLSKGQEDDIPFNY